MTRILGLTLIDCPQAIAHWPLVERIGQNTAVLTADELYDVLNQNLGTLIAARTEAHKRRLISFAACTN